MTREELDKMNAQLAEMRRSKIKAMEATMRTTGWRRAVNRFFARTITRLLRIAEKAREEIIKDEFNDPPHRAQGTAGTGRGWGGRE